MRKERIVRATFSNGKVLERGSLSRVYTHAYLYTWRKAGGSEDHYGFSTSEEQCRKNLAAESAWARKRRAIIFEEVVPVVEIEKRGEG